MTRSHSKQTYIFSGNYFPGEKDLYAASMPDVCLPIGCMPSICVVCLSKGDRLTQYAQSMSEYAGRLKERDARGIQGHTAAARKWSYASSMPDEILALREIQQYTGFEALSRQRQFDIEPMSRNSTASNMIDDVVCGRFLLLFCFETGRIFVLGSTSKSTYRINIVTGVQFRNILNQN